MRESLLVTFTQLQSTPDNGLIPIKTHALSTKMQWYKVTGRLDPIALFMTVWNKGKYAKTGMYPIQFYTLNIENLSYIPFPVG